MDKFDLDFLVDSQDADLLYKHILEAICSNSDKIRNGINRYMVGQVIMHSLGAGILYRSRYDVADIRRVYKYAMEL